MEEFQEQKIRKYDNSLFEPPKPSVKRKKLTILLSIIGVVALIIVLVGPSKIMNTWYKTFASDKSYFDWVEKKNAEVLWDYILKADKEDKSTETTIKLSVSNLLKNVLSISDDIQISSKSDRKKGMANQTVQATYGDKDLFQLLTYINLNQNEVYAQLPELSNKYVALSTKDNASIIVKFKDVKSIFLKYYSELIRNSVSDVTSENNQKLTINDVTITATKLTANFKLEDVATQLVVISEEMKIDEKLMDMVGKNGLKKSEYKALFTNISSFLNSWKETLHGEEELVVECYIDSNGKIIGHTISVKGLPYQFSYLIKEKEGELQILAEVKSGTQSLVTMDVMRKEKGKPSQVEEVKKEFVVDQDTYLNEVTKEDISQFVLKIMESLGLSEYSDSLLPMLEGNFAIPFLEGQVEVELGNYKGIVVTKPSAEISEEELQEEIMNFTQFYSKMMPITNRDRIEDGDIVQIDFVGTANGIEFEGGTANDYELKIGSNTFVDDFEAQLVGKKVGDQVTVNVTFPSDYSNTDLAGIDASFLVTIDAIGVREFTDAFVAYNTEYETSEAYKDYLYEGLMESKNYDVQSEIQETILTEIVNNSIFRNIPEREIKEKRAEMLSTYETYASYYQVDLDTYVNSVFGIAMDDFDRELDYYADQYVKETYALAKIAETEKITLTDEEYQKRIEEVMEQYGIQTKEEIEGDYGGKAGLSKVFLEKKVLDYLLEKAIIE